MAKKVNDVTQLIGDTPVVRLNGVGGEGDATLWAKLEFFNPGGSVKDRIGLSMIREAEERGGLKPGDTIIEPTSGNTGIGLAMVAAVRGYKVIFTMPAAMSQERRDLLSAYGAELVLVQPGEGPGMTGAIKKAEELAKENGYFMPQQFNNLANPTAHENTTGPEIVEAFQDTGLDYFVSGIGTGGTITGAGRVLRKHFPDIKIYAVEPSGSPVLSGGQPGKHTIQGIGAGFIPDILDTEIYDEIIQVNDEDAVETTQALAAKEGILVGKSSGAAAWAALQVAKDQGADKHVLVILPDTGERYLSTDLFK
ncbi:MAG: cysteine synthase A [Candidatus Latescibacterota bacterium]|jgi:cysteine synthase A